MIVENRALQLVGRLARHGVAGVPGLPLDLHRLVGELRRTHELTDAGLQLLDAWRHLLLADGAEQAVIDWFARDRQVQRRLTAWAAANPYAADGPADLLAESRWLEAEAADLLDAYPTFFAGAWVEEADV